MRVRCCEATFFEAHADEQRIITEAHLAADAARIGALIGRAVGELRALLEAKADPNQARSDGRTALIFCSQVVSSYLVSSGVAHVCQITR